MMPSCVQCPARAAAAAEATPPSSSHDQPGSVLGLRINMFISHHGSTINMYYMLTLHAVKQTERQMTNVICFYAKLTTEPGTFMAYLVFDGLLY